MSKTGRATLDRSATVLSICLHEKGDLHHGLSTIGYKKWQQAATIHGKIQVKFVLPLSAVFLPTGNNLENNLHSVSCRWDITRHDSDSNNDDPRQYPYCPESFPHRWPFLEEMWKFDFLDCRRPLHIIPEQVGKSAWSALYPWQEEGLWEDLQCCWEMIWETTKEKEEKYDPFKIADQGVSDRVGVKTILEKRWGDVRETWEDNNA